MFDFAFVLQFLREDFYSGISRDTSLYCLV